MNLSAVSFTVRRELNSFEVISGFMDKTFYIYLYRAGNRPPPIGLELVELDFFEITNPLPFLLPFTFLNGESEAPLNISKFRIWFCSGSYFRSHCEAKEMCLFSWLSKQTWQIKTQNSLQRIVNVKKENLELSNAFYKILIDCSIKQCRTTSGIAWTFPS